MLKSDSYNDMVDDCGTESVDATIMDNLNNTENMFTIEDDPDGRYNGRSKPDSHNYNHELRLVNDYFQEVGTESLLSQSGELRVAAKIKKCQKQAETLNNTITTIIDKKMGPDIEISIEGFKAILDRGSYKRRFKKSEWEDFKKLVYLLDAYMSKEIQLRNRFIKSNLRLVASMAKKYAGRGIPFLDLIQEGNLGLMKAVDRFDHTKGYRFSTYACWWITQAMTRGVFNQTRTVKIPAYVLEKAGKVWAERAKFVEREDREPHPSEIAKNVGMSVENVKQVLESKKTANTVCLDSPVWNGEKATFMDYIPDSNSMPVDCLIDEISIPASVRRALHALGSREREIVQMRYGIGYNDSFTLDDIGKRFALTRERIRQIEKKALLKLRKSTAAPALKSLLAHN